MKRKLQLITMLLLLPIVTVFSAEKSKAIKQQLIKLTITLDSKDMSQEDIEQILKEFSNYKNVKEIEVDTAEAAPITICD